MTSTASKRNGGMAWLLGISGTLFTALAIGSFGLLWGVSNDVSAIAASMVAMDKRMDRSDARWTSAFDQIDGRLRDVEWSER